jgi:hypothetical protein
MVFVLLLPITHKGSLNHLYTFFFLPFLFLLPSLLFFFLHFYYPYEKCQRVKKEREKPKEEREKGWGRKETQSVGWPPDWADDAVEP